MTSYHHHYHLLLKQSFTHFHKVVEQVDSLLQGFLQVLAERQVLGMVADLLHSPPLCLLCGLLCPVFIIVISILTDKQMNGNVRDSLTIRSEDRQLSTSHLRSRGATVQFIKNTPPSFLLCQRPQNKAWWRHETHHSIWSIKIVLVSSLSTAGAVLLVLLTVLLLLLFLHRCRSTRLVALCKNRSRVVQSNLFILKLLDRFHYGHHWKWKRTRWVFENERAEFVSGVKHATEPTGLTGSADGLFLGIDILGEGED